MKEKIKTHYSFTRKVAYVATKGYIRVISTEEEYWKSKEVEDYLNRAKSPSYAQSLSDKALNMFGKGFRLYIYTSFNTPEDGGEGAILQYRNEDDVAKSYLLFSNIIFIHVFEDYKLLNLTPTRDYVINVKSEIQEVAKINPFAAAPEPKESPIKAELPQLYDTSAELEYVAENGEVKVYKGTEYIGHIYHGLKHKRIGWHTLVLRCTDIYTPSWPACYATLDAAKARINKEHAPPKLA